MSDEVGKTPGSVAEEADVAQTDARPAVAEAPEPVSAGASQAVRAAEGAIDGDTGAEAAPGLDASQDSVTLDAVLQGHSALEPATGLLATEDALARVANPQLKAIIEALIFASPEPLTPKMLFKLLEGEPKEDVELALDSLRQDYEHHGGVQMVEVAGGYQIVTRPEMHEWVRRLFHERKTQKLSVQALETLAVIAYKQPVTGPEITEIRGVNTAGVLSTLLERHLIKIAGRKAVVGRPFLYATTREFLIRFGLRDLGDLPKVEDLADVLGFAPPAGLADSGPIETRLPLEGEGEGESTSEEPPEGEDAEPEEQVH